MSYHLKKFAAIAKSSTEYQGHGWGCAYLKDKEWKIYKNIQPIWEDNLEQFDKTDFLLVHARSAFRDKGIKIENNMPFQNNSNIFIFNGELHGVKIKEKGRIGAEKIFNYILRFNHGDLLNALKKATTIIVKRSSYIKAMNIIMANKKNAFFYTYYNENPDYFSMYSKQNVEQQLICSDPYLGEKGWKNIANQTIEVI